MFTCLPSRIIRFDALTGRAFDGMCGCVRPLLAAPRRALWVADLAPFLGSTRRQAVLSTEGVPSVVGGSGEHRFSLSAVAFGTSSFGVWSSRRCRLGELTLGWYVPAPPG